MALDGPGSEAALEIKAAATTPSDLESYVAAVERHIAIATEQGRPTAPAWLEIARVRFDQLGQIDSALDTLRQALESSGGDPTLQVELATRLRLAGRHAEALGELNRLLAADLTRLDTWHDLVRTYQSMQRNSEARLAAMSLVVLGGASDREVELLHAVPSRTGKARAGAFTGETLRSLVPWNPAEQSAIGLLEVLEAGLGKLYPSDLESYGLSPRDRITSRSGSALRQLADEVAGVFGVTDFELFVHRVRTKGVEVELGTAPSLLVPATIAELPEAQQIFLLARPLANIAQRLHPIDKLTPRELEVLLASAARLVSPGYGGGLTSEDFLEEQARRIHKSLPRRARKALEEAAGRYVEAPRLDFPRFCRTVRLTANRVGALLSDDLPGSIDVMRRTERDLAGLDGPALARASDQVADLLRFWMSNTAMQLRRHAGLLRTRTGTKTPAPAAPSA